MAEYGPSVEMFEVHLEGDHIVYYKEGEHENTKTMDKKIYGAYCIIFC